MGKRVTVYIQDELWDEAHALASDLTPSQLVQRGLRCLLTASNPTGREAPSELPAGVAEDSPLYASFLQTRDRLLHEARQGYGEGAAAGYQTAALLTWQELAEAVEISRLTGLRSLGDVGRWLTHLEWSWHHARAYADPEHGLGGEEAAAREVRYRDLLDAIQSTTGWQAVYNDEGDFEGRWNFGRNGGTYRRGFEDAMRSLHRSIERTLNPSPVRRPPEGR